MKRSAVVLVALGFGASLAGCGGDAAREASALRLVTGARQIRGVDVWEGVESIYPRNKIIYQENVVVNLSKKQLAITFQENPAPYRVGEPGPDETSPLTFENAARNLLTALDGSRKLFESDLTYDAVKELTVISERVVLHAREAVRALELKDREFNISAKPDTTAGGVAGGRKLRAGEGEARALVEHWMLPARLIEYNATNLLAFSATHRKSGIEDWSAALLKSCVELEKTYAGRRRRRRKPTIKTETQEAQQDEPDKGNDEKPEDGSEEGPAKAATPGGEEQPEAGSGSSPVGKDGNPDPDAGPPQVGAFLLGVAGRRRSSRSRRRAN